MPNKHFIIDPNGEEHTRTSQNREYTHCVIARRSYEHALMSARDPRRTKTDRRNWAYYVKTADEAPRGDWDNSPAKAREIIAEYPSADAYIKAQEEERVAHVEKLKAKGGFESYGSLGWCGRYDLAAKKLNQEGRSGYFDHVLIVEARRR